LNRPKRVSLLFAGLTARVLLGWPIGTFVGFGLVVFFLVANLRQKLYGLVLAGMLLNFLVIGLNAGMPVSLAALNAYHRSNVVRRLQRGTKPGYHPLSADDRLGFLGDVIPIGWPVDSVISPGDALVYTGVGGLILSSMISHWRKREASQLETLAV
jgi:hypothetical protein